MTAGRFLKGRGAVWETEAPSESSFTDLSAANTSLKRQRDESPVRPPIHSLALRAAMSLATSSKLRSSASPRLHTAISIVTAFIAPESP